MYLLFIHTSTLYTLYVSTMQAQQLIQSSNVGYDPTAHEDEPKKLSVGISIQNLTKIYDEVSSQLTLQCLFKITLVHKNIVPCEMAPFYITHMLYAKLEFRMFIMRGI